MADERKETHENKDQTSEVTLLDQLQQSFNNFNLREEISQLRVEANHAVVKADRAYHFVKEKVHTPFQWKDDIHQQMHIMSSYLNDTYPYAATWCHSHPSMVVGSTVLFAGYPIRKAPKPFFVGVVMGSVAVAAGTCFLFNFKYNHPYDSNYSLKPSL
ncbi:hypothetical protein EON65_01330 [archaeon]|nr:MAG: hypothetical protein EON65_01330 [archaeon]